MAIELLLGVTRDLHGTYYSYCFSHLQFDTLPDYAETAKTHALNALEMELGDPDALDIDDVDPEDGPIHIGQLQIYDDGSWIIELDPESQLIAESRVLTSYDR